MHKLIKESGFGEQLKIRPMTDSNELSIFLGRKARYKQDLLTPEFLRNHGSIVRDEIFEIREVQKDYKGKDMLRGYFEGDSFGRVIDPAHIETVIDR